MCPSLRAARWDGFTRSLLERSTNETGPGSQQDASLWAGLQTFEQKVHYGQEVFFSRRMHKFNRMCCIFWNECFFRCCRLLLDAFLSSTSPLFERFNIVQSFIGFALYIDAWTHKQPACPSVQIYCMYKGQQKKIPNSITTPLYAQGACVWACVCARVRLLVKNFGPSFVFSSSAWGANH